MTFWHTVKQNNLVSAFWTPSPVAGPVLFAQNAALTKLWFDLSLENVFNRHVMSLSLQITARWLD